MDWNANDPGNFRMQLAEDVNQIKGATKDLALAVHDESPGAYEVVLDTSRYDEESARMADSMEDLARGYGDSARATEVSNEIGRETLSYLRRNGEQLEEIHVGINGLKRLGEANLTLLGISLLMQREGLGRLDAIEDRLTSIDDNLVEIYDTLRDIETGQAALTQAVKDGAERIAGALDRGVERIVGALFDLDAHAEARHQELMRAMVTPRTIRAEEKFQQAVIQFRTGNISKALRELRKALEDDSTHMPALMLFGRCCYRQGRPREAKAAFRQTAALALDGQDCETYIAAILRLSRLERLLGNKRAANVVLREAMNKAPKEWGPLLVDLAYEHIASNWITFQRRNRAQLLKGTGGMPAEAGKFIKLLQREVFVHRPEMRDVVAKSPDWELARMISPSLNLGNDRFITLIEALCGDDVYKACQKKYPKRFGHLPIAALIVPFWVRPIINIRNEDDTVRPFPRDADEAAILLHLLWPVRGSRKADAAPEATGALTWLQKQIVPRGQRLKVVRYREFWARLEQILLAHVRLNWANPEAQRDLLRRVAECWGDNSKSEIIAFALLLLDLKVHYHAVLPIGGSLSIELIRRVRRDLPTYLARHPELAKVVAAEPAFQMASQYS